MKLGRIEQTLKGFCCPIVKQTVEYIAVKWPGPSEYG